MARPFVPTDHCSDCAVRLDRSRAFHLFLAVVQSLGRNVRLGLFTPDARSLAPPAGELYRPSPKRAQFVARDRPHRQQTAPHKTSPAKRNKGSGRGHSAMALQETGLLRFARLSLLAFFAEFLTRSFRAVLSRRLSWNIPTTGRIARVSQRPRRKREGAVAAGAGDAGAGVCAKAAPVNIAAANPNAITFPNVFIVLTFAIFIALSLSSDREPTATNFASGLFERRRTIARMRRAWQGNLSQLTPPRDLSEAFLFNRRFAIKTSRLVNL